MKGLIIKSPWIDKILAGEKTWEIRGSNTTHRGHTELIKSTTGMIYGSAELVATKRLANLDLHYNHIKHLVTDYDEISYKHIWAWIFEKPLKYKEPIPYKHPQGAVIWVNLDKEAM